MSKITYLLGAGASANALPVLAEISSRLVFFKMDVEAFITHECKIDEYKSFVTQGRKLVDDISFFSNAMGSHLTVDTYARKLFAREALHPDLRRLKRVLSCYLVYEQLPINPYIRENVTKQYPDRRYDSLIASLLSYEVDNTTLADEVKILSWNYDVQLELAYMLFTGKEHLKDIHEPLQIIPGKWIKDKEIDLSRFALVHLNGVAGYKNIINDKENVSSVIDTYIENKTTRGKMLSSIIKYYDELSTYEDYGADEPEEVSYFNYSWESKSNNHNFLNPFAKHINDSAFSIAKQTEVLIVIGYSFPIFNRWYDSELIKSMNNLEKVYIQDKKPELIHTTMMNAFAKFQTNYFKSRFSLSDNLDQFVIPSELTL